MLHPGAARIDAAKARSLLADAAAHAAANGHPRLWRAVADAALGAGELKAAERAYVRCLDYNVSRAFPNAHGDSNCLGSLGNRRVKLCQSLLRPTLVSRYHSYLLSLIKHHRCTSMRWPWRPRACQQRVCSVIP